MENKMLDTYPVLPLRDMVMFPSMLVPLFVGRKKSMKALEQANISNKILLVAQRSSAKEDPKDNDLYKVGIIANVLQILKMQDSTVKVLVEGVEAVKIIRYSEHEGFTVATVKPFERSYNKNKVDAEAVKALKRSLVDHFENYVKLTNKVPAEVVAYIAKATSLESLSNGIASHLLLDVSKRQKILEQNDLVKASELVLKYLNIEIEMLNMENKIKNRVRGQIDKNQKEYYLNEQLKAIHKELGESDFKEELKELVTRANKIKMTKEAKEKVSSEINKLKTMSPMSSESSVVRNYVDWVLDLPWKKSSVVSKDIKKSVEILDQHHYGLEKIKERIVEYLAVNLRTSELKSPIICFVGPPGVGKTSLAKSIAEATGRKFAKIALGGLRDEAEIKGHRRTYIGAMPGKVIQAMKKVKTNNPVILLDEIDKMSSDYRGDPSSALLEVLDPEQNKNFNDHYLEVEYDLSQVMFIATSNSMNIPHPLRDRMEIIRLSGYTEDEKLAIAKKYLVPKQEKSHGLKKGEIVIEEKALEGIIQYYTREAGVRNLDREIAKISRKAVKEIMLDNNKDIKVNGSNLKQYLGVKKFDYNITDKKDAVGITNGLAYTEVGGDLLAIEAVTLFGKGDVKITGKLGDVMKESIQAALSYIKSRAPEFGINPKIFKYRDIHIHVPEGATPKDGPSAGIAMCTSIVSILSGIAVKKDVAMTGEVTLRGNVLEIGGLKEKLLSAVRGKIDTVLIPKSNEKDLEDMPKKVLKSLNIIPVSHVDEVLKVALTKLPAPIEWTDEDEVFEYKEIQSNGRSDQSVN